MSIDLTKVEWDAPDPAKVQWDAPTRMPPLVNAAGEIQPEPEPYDARATRVGAFKAAGKAVVRGGAQLLDMINPLPIAGEVLSYLGNRTRLRATLPESADKDLRNRQASEYAQAIAKEHAEFLGAGIFEKLAQEFLPSDPNFLNAAMEEVGKMAVSIGDAYESKSKGAVTSEDVQQAFNALMFGGLSKLATAGKRTPVGLKEVTPPIETPPAAPAQPGIRALTPEEVRARDLGEAKARREKRSDVRAAVDDGLPTRAEMERVGGAGWELTESDRIADLVAGQVEARNAARAEAARLTPETAAPRTRPPEATIADDTAKTLSLNEFGDLSVTAPAALDRALAKVHRGRSFDLTAEELSALKKSSSSWDRPTIAKIAGMGVAGAATLAYVYGGDVDGETARAIIPFAVLAAMPDSTPLGTIRNSLKNSFKTLDRLPDKAVLTTDQIRQQLNRADVTKAEKDVFAAALLGTEGKIYAKDLVERIRKETQDFELKPVETDDFATYGIDSIGRTPRPTDYDRAGAWIPEETLPEDIPRIEAEHAQRIAELDAAATSARTTIYQSPFALGDANHFGDPNYFAHTRSFDEGGVRHVVEIQSDLAQKAKKTLTAEERAALQKESETAQAVYDQLREISDRWESGKVSLAQIEAAYAPLRRDIHQLTANDGPMFAQMRPEDLLRRARRAERASRLQLDELNAKLLAADSSKVEPMLKNWYRRIVDEEIGQATGGGARTIRFATADTVAKVEGWPRERAPLTAEERAYLRGELNYMPTAPEGAFRPEHQSIYDRYRGDIAKYLRSLGGKPVTDAQGHTWIEVPLPEAQKGGRIVPPKMFGGADQRLMNALAAAGLGAAAANFLAQPENRDLAMSVGAVLAGGAVLLSSKVPAIAEAASTAAKGLDYALGSLSTGIGAISQSIRRRLDQFELASLAGTYQSVERVSAFANGYLKLPLAIQERLKPLILTNSSLAIQRELRRYPELAAAWTEARAELDRLGREMKDAGLIKELLPDYFPRIVGDLEGLRAHLGVEHRTGLDAALALAKSKAGRTLDEVERSIVINKFLEKREGFGSGKPSFSKPRRVGEVDLELARFYESPEVSLTKYAQRASTSIARAKFFGRDLVLNPTTGLVDIGASVGALVDRELAAGRITAKQFAELDKMLKSRFGPGEETGWAFFNNVKQLTQVGLLGHAANAAVQLSDTAISAIAHGILPTVKALQSIVTRKPSRVTAREFGLVDHLAEEFAGTTRVKKFVDFGFKYSGFRAVDLLGKGTALTASLLKNQKLASTPKGAAALDAKWSGYFGDDLVALKSDLKAGRRTALVDELLFRELADLQPITRSEMPQAYLDMPNGRQLYTLKSFMLKQADIIRREVVQNFRAGKHGLATKQALKFGLAMGVGGASGDFVRNWILGRETDDMTWETVAANAFKVYGLSDYLREQVQKKGPVDTIIENYAGWPPAKAMDHIITLDPKAIQYIPIGGRMLYNRFPFEEGGLTGAELANEKRQKTRERRERDADPVIRQERRERKLDRVN